MALSENRTVELVSPDVAGFVSRLATAWRSGEVRPPHRQAPNPGRRWRTRPDPFAEVWPVLLGWLEEQPDLEAKAMLKRLQASGYGEFPDGQLRTLQRRVRVCGGCRLFNNWSTVNRLPHQTRAKIQGHC